MLRYNLVLFAGLWVASTAGAATWADALFTELSKDFGSVPRGPTLTHPFRVTNTTRNTITISGIRVSCGCVSTTVGKYVLNPGEETVVTAKMDTTRFTGLKSVTIYVQFSSPTFDEVRLWVQANGRNDFNITPDTLAFGQVKRGASPIATVRVTFYGNGESRILQAKAESNYVVPTFKEVHRHAHEVAYDVSVKLREDTPVGKWYTDMWVKTNILTMPQVRVPLTVEVESPLTVSPSVVLLGAVKVEDESMRRIIVRGIKPFKITTVKGADDMVVVAAPSKESREVHVLTIRLKPTRSGNVDRLLRVVTDLKDENEIDFRVQAMVVR